MIWLNAVMNVSQLIALIRSEIARLRSEHAELVTIASLETLLAAVENHLAQQPEEPIAAFAIEHAKLQHASNLVWYEARERMRAELFKSVISTAKVLIKSLILINGGAAVALLAFIGHLATAETHTGAPIHAFACPLACFVFGVGAAALFAGFVAAAQKLYAEAYNQRTIKDDAKHGRRLEWGANACVLVSIVFALCSVAAFALGSYLAYEVFATM
jgi:divalent metal cation (Fe/Co/Zn/Cd) transporter